MFHPIIKLLLILYNKNKQQQKQNRSNCIFDLFLCLHSISRLIMFASFAGNSCKYLYVA